MKAIASNIFDFTTWYKFGNKLIIPDMVIDLSIVEQKDEELIQKTGYFEEEYELFFLQIPENLLVEPKRTFSFHDIQSIAPLTEAGGDILRIKFPDFNIDKAIPTTLSNIIISARNKHLSILGGIRITTAFGIEKSERLINFQNAFLPGILNYLTDLNAEQNSTLENLLFYERSKPYPVADVGYFYDLGNIARSRFHITDDELKSKEILKENDPAKYSFINEVLSLSKFLQQRREENVWDEFLTNYKHSDSLVNLNASLSLVEEDNNINHLLVIALYLKFRDQIRNISNLDDPKFKLSVKHFLKVLPEESSIALLLTGMFFGGIKFRELYYQQFPPIISQVYRGSTQEIKMELSDTKNDKVSEKISTNFATNTDAQPAEYIFNETNWTELEAHFLDLSKARIKILKESYFQVSNLSTELFSSPLKTFLSLLKRKLKNTKSTKGDTKSADEIFEAVEKFLLT